MQNNSRGLTLFPKDQYAMPSPLLLLWPWLTHSSLVSFTSCWSSDLPGKCCRAGHLHTPSSACTAPPPDVVLAYSSLSSKSLLKGYLAKNVFCDQASWSSTHFVLSFVWRQMIHLFICILYTQHTHVHTYKNVNSLKAGTLVVRSITLSAAPRTVPGL